MDRQLRRLRQELLSMKEVGDGLHEQMNCMMGALQELKLLQVQTALEQLEISGSQNTVSSVEQHQRSRSGREVPRAGLEAGQQNERLLGKVLADKRSPTSFTASAPALRSASLLGPATLPEGGCLRDTTSSSSQSICDEEVYRANGPSPTLSRAKRFPAGTPEPGRGSMARNQPSRAATSVRSVRAVGTLGRGDCQGCDDGNDWTSSLMSQSRNRQPLVLGDNIFADLVGNWLDLPELDKKGEKSEASLSVSRSQELYRKFSLTANIFKKFLRSVRPDRDRLLKEKPCWLPHEDKQLEISKRPKKMNKLKGTFYFPLHGNTQNNHSKVERCPKVESNSDKPKIGTKKVHDTIDYPQSSFDINTAVWV
ncbi:PAK4-inhibitor INKA2 isoform X1 [Struthio camelus]|uniref:PAK4-inhibitor INKA2 isoform X1 n=2 Tax=Struthio camelus TaxID=8801 RepID=UPI00360412F7